MKTREKLIYGARECVLQNGSLGASVKSIAKAAGVNHGLIHHYFGSKEQLYVELIIQEAKRTRELFNSVKESGNIRSFLTDLIFTKSKLIRELSALSKDSPRLEEEIKNFLIERCRDVGELLNINSYTKQLMITSSLLGLALHSSIDPEIPVDEVVDSIMESANNDQMEQTRFAV
ncbi:MAG TPA: hypothetical protein DCZ03_04695 [Gammaproteobacteria bacterium]|nr:hypothetical protein [Gammaproteobacteria bacterium]